MVDLSLASHGWNALDPLQAIKILAHRAVSNAMTTDAMRANAQS